MVVLLGRPNHLFTRGGEELVSTILGAFDDLDLDNRIMAPVDGNHGDEKGVCTSRNHRAMRPLVEVMDRPNAADLATTVIHEYAHTLLHFDIADNDERSKREVEAEAVAYVVGRCLRLDTSNSAFYLAAWQGDKPGIIRDRLERISSASVEFIELIDR